MWSDVAQLWRVRSFVAHCGAHRHDKSVVLPCPNVKRFLSVSILTFGALYGLGNGQAHALQVYKSVGQHGEVMYSQYPPEHGRHVQRITLRDDGRQDNPGQLAGQTDTTESAKAANTNTNRPTDPRLAQLQNRLNQQQARDQAQRCQSLRNNLTNLSVDGRVYELDKQGDRRYLDNQQIKQRRQKVQQALKQYCSNSST